MDNIYSMQDIQNSLLASNVTSVADDDKKSESKESFSQWVLNELCKQLAEKFGVPFKEIASAQVLFDKISTDISNIKEDIEEIKSAKHTSQRKKALEKLLGPGGDLDKFDKDKADLKAFAKDHPKIHLPSVPGMSSDIDVKDFAASLDDIDAQFNDKGALVDSSLRKVYEKIERDPSQAKEILKSVTKCLNDPTGYDEFMNPITNKADTADSKVHSLQTGEEYAMQSYTNAQNQVQKALLSISQLSDFLAQHSAPKS